MAVMRTPPLMLGTAIGRDSLVDLHRFPSLRHRKKPWFKVQLEYKERKCIYWHESGRLSVGKLLKLSRVECAGKYHCSCSPTTLIAGKRLGSGCAGWPAASANLQSLAFTNTPLRRSCSFHNWMCWPETSSYTTETPVQHTPGHPHLLLISAPFVPPGGHIAECQCIPVHTDYSSSQSAKPVGYPQSTQRTFLHKATPSRLG